jgi:hypothetical protein
MLKELFKLIPEREWGTVLRVILEERAKIKKEFEKG